MKSRSMPVLIALAALSLSACGGGGGQRAGAMTGLATDAAGNPLAGVEVSIYGTTLAGGEDVQFDVKTGADGRYELDLPAGNYASSAYWDFTFNGRRYRQELHPVKGHWDDEPSRDGIVRDFVWRLSGLHPRYERSEGETYAYYGGAANVSVIDVYYESWQTNHFASEFPNGFTVEVTLVPQGPLADGSQGSTVTWTEKVDAAGDADFKLVDVPLGRYAASAKAIKPDGTERALGITYTGKYGGSSDGAPQATADLEFLPESGITGGLSVMSLRMVYGAPYPAP